MFAEHDVDVLAGHAASALLGDRHDVKSHHHQGFGELGSGLREAARAPDGTIEALEDPSRRFTLGVLWHPKRAKTQRSSKRWSPKPPIAYATPRSGSTAPRSLRTGRLARPVPSPNERNKSETIHPQTMRGDASSSTVRP